MRPGEAHLHPPPAGGVGEPRSRVDAAAKRPLDRLAQWQRPTDQLLLLRLPLEQRLPLRLVVRQLPLPLLRLLLLLQPQLCILDKRRAHQARFAAAAAA